MRKHKTQIATSIDGVEENTPSHFKEIYEDLYNPVDDNDEMLKLKSEIDNSISYTHLTEVYKVTPKVLKEVASKLCD